MKPIRYLRVVHVFIPCMKACLTEVILFQRFDVSCLILVCIFFLLAQLTLIGFGRVSFAECVKSNYVLLLHRLRRMGILSYEVV